MYSIGKTSSQPNLHMSAKNKAKSSRSKSSRTRSSFRWALLKPTAERLIFKLQRLDPSRLNVSGTPVAMMKRRVEFDDLTLTQCILATGLPIVRARPDSDVFDVVCNAGTVHWFRALGGLTQAQVGLIYCLVIISDLPDWGGAPESGASGGSSANSPTGHASSHAATSEADVSGATRDDSSPSAVDDASAELEPKSAVTPGDAVPPREVSTGRGANIPNTGRRWMAVDRALADFAFGRLDDRDRAIVEKQIHHTPLLVGMPRGVTLRFDLDGIIKR